LRAIKVGYEVHPHVVHAHAAIKPDAPKVVDEENNLQEKNKNGDPEKAEAALATADAIVEGESFKGTVQVEGADSIPVEGKKVPKLNR
jgi:CO/xanthine dehydrogenase Mo-binding subunit